MDIGRKKTIRNTVIKSLDDTYPHDLNLYTKKPFHQITLNEFTDLACDRIKLLRIIENAGVKLRILSEEWRQQIYEDVKKENLNEYFKLIKIPGCGSSESEVIRRKNDHISHFITLLAASQSDSYRQWVLKQEIDLFKLRFHNLTSDGLNKFIEISNLMYKPISEEEKAANIERLYDSTASLSPAQVDNSNFFKVRFWEVPDLIKNMKVLLKAGYAYVPSNELISVIINIFRSNMSHNLSLCAAHYENFVDERVRPILQNLFKTYTGEDYSVPKDMNDVPVFMIDTLSMQSFPLCMRRMHEITRNTSHLKYHGRQQYQLFLKGIGVNMDACVQFFRECFTKKVDSNKFDKMYAYNIRHNYGKEGSRTNYTPMSCVRIINSSVGSGDTHGCPFAHEDHNTLKKRLTDYGITVQGLMEIMDLLKNKHYQLACSKYFEFTHKNKPIAVIHPNQYFEESRKMRIADDPTHKQPLRQKSTVKNTRSSQSSTMSQVSKCTSQNSSSQSSVNECSEVAKNVNHSTQNSIDAGVMDWDNDGFDISEFEEIEGM